MRLSRLFPVSFVGALLFTPAIAEDIEQVHEKALEVLRQQQASGGAAPASSASPGVSTNRSADFDRFRSENERARAERDARVRQGVAEAEAQRQQRLDQRRTEFERFVREREALRQQQREHDQNAVKAAGGLNAAPSGAASDEVHSKALEILRQQQAAPSRSLTTPDPVAVPVETSAQPALQPSSVTEAELAPRVIAQQDGATGETHSRALEVLRQQMAGQPASQAPAPRSIEPQPTPETRERVRQILQDPTPSSAASQASRPQLAPPPADPDYSRELEQRALQMLGQTAPQQPPVSTAFPAPVQPSVVSSPAASSFPASGSSDVHSQALEVLRSQQQSAPAVNSIPTPSTQPAPSAINPRTQEILRKQDQELARQTGGTVSSTPSTPALDPQAEAQAREMLRQQSAAAPTAIPFDAAANPTVAGQVDNNAVTYSRELEERARQQLLQGGQFQPAATAPATTTVTTTTAPVIEAPATPAYSVPQHDIATVHAQALEALRQAQPAPATAVAPGAIVPETMAPAIEAPKTKRQRLQELTDAYKADKMTPAEYHEQRARIIAEP